MRKEPDETAEMVNQVLFGESFSIIEQDRERNFSLISLHHDQYEGWINSRCIRFLSEADWEMIKEHPVSVTHEPMETLTAETMELQIVIGCGSIIRYSSPGKTIIDQNVYNVPISPPQDTYNIRENLVQFGLKLVSIPYLWGGRSSFGFDCSGLCQNIFRQAGIQIPRDASQQANHGKPVNFIAEALAGDLAFFDNNDGNIIHVGMILNNGKIIHASGKVKIDELDHQGIFSREQNRYTHQLRLIKKFID